MNLSEYLEKWNLVEPKLISKTATSYVYKVKSDNTIYVLKLLTQTGIEDEAKGATALKFFDGSGAVKLIEHDSKAHLLEYADGPDLKEQVLNGQDAKATEIIADTILTLHKKRKKEIPSNLTSLKDRYRSLINSTDETYLVFKKAKAVLGKLLDSAKDLTVLHGDIHHENILFNSQRGWVAIDPKGLVGEGTYDLANALINPVTETNLVQSPDTFTRRVASLNKITGHSKSRIVAYAFTHACLSACWTLENGNDPKHALTMARVIEPLLESF